jgi:hypothetical protein
MGEVKSAGRAAKNGTIRRSRGHANSRVNTVAYQMFSQYEKITMATIATPIQTAGHSASTSL